MIPLVAVQAIDAAVLAWERAVTPDQSLAKRRGSEFSVAPTIEMLNSGGAIGIAGAF